MKDTGHQGHGEEAQTDRNDAANTFSAGGELVPYVYEGTVVGIGELGVAPDNLPSERTVPLSEQAEVTVEAARLALANMAAIDPRRIASKESLDAAFQDFAPTLTKIIPELFGGPEGISEENAGHRNGSYLDLGKRWKAGGELITFCVSYAEGAEVGTPGEEWKIAKDRMANGAEPQAIRLHRLRRHRGERNTENVQIRFPSDDPTAPSAGRVEVKHEITYPAEVPDTRGEYIRVGVSIHGDDTEPVAPEDYGLAAFGLSRLAATVLARDQELMSEHTSRS